jgi:hypothetical protein
MGPVPGRSPPHLGIPIAIVGTGPVGLSLALAREDPTVKHRSNSDSSPPGAPPGHRSKAKDSPCGYSQRERV